MEATRLKKTRRGGKRWKKGKTSEKEGEVVDDGRDVSMDGITCDETMQGEPTTSMKIDENDIVEAEISPKVMVSSVSLGKRKREASGVGPTENDMILNGNDVGIPSTDVKSIVSVKIEPSLSHSPTKMNGFTALNDAKKGDYYNVAGVVVYHRRPEETRTQEYKMLIKMVDPSHPDISNGVTVNIFKRHKDEMPMSVNHGDIFVGYRVKCSEFNGRTQFYAYPNTRTVIHSAANHIPPVFSPVNTDTVRQVEVLKAWWAGQNSAVVPTEGMVAMRNGTPIRSTFRASVTFSEVPYDQNIFFDFTGQVILIDDYDGHRRQSSLSKGTPDRIFLFLCDYTVSSAPAIKFDDDDDDLQTVSGFKHPTRGHMIPQEYIFKVAVCDSFAARTRAIDVRQGMYVRLQNVYAERCGRSGCVVGNLGDGKDGRRAAHGNIEIVDDTSFHGKALICREKEWASSQPRLPSDPNSSMARSAMLHDASNVAEHAPALQVASHMASGAELQGKSPSFIVSTLVKNGDALPACTIRQARDKMIQTNCVFYVRATVIKMIPPRVDAFCVRVCRVCHHLMKEHYRTSPQCDYPEPEWRYDFKLLLADATTPSETPNPSDMLEISIKDADIDMKPSKNVPKASHAPFWFLADIPPCDLLRNKRDLIRIRRYMDALMQQKQPLGFAIVAKEDIQGNVLIRRHFLVDTQLVVKQE